jgi:FixJ family two-component response regulator
MGVRAGHSPQSLVCSARLIHILPSIEMAGETIGLIDDDRAVRRGLTRLLEACGYRVEAFESADAFVQAQPVTAIDCLLLDLRLPGTTGLGLYDRLAVHGCQIPIIFITGQADAVTTGGTDGRTPIAVLVKPFNEHALLAAINAAMTSMPRQPAPTLP